MEEDHDIVEPKQNPYLTVSAVPVKDKKKRLNPEVTPSFQSDKDKGYVLFQDQNLSLKQSIMLHFKPSHIRSPIFHLLLFLVDFLLSLAFQAAHMAYFLGETFADQNNHVLHVLIGGGFTTIILIYCFSDGVRYLRSNVDRVMYLICCILQKPILLPVLMPSRFGSRIAEKHISTHSFKIDESRTRDGKLEIIEKVILPTNFLLAVQECNFLYSFTSSGFVAFSSVCTLLIGGDASSDSDESNARFYMLMLSLVYFIYGSILSVYLYGRKTDYMFHDEHK